MTTASGTRVIVLIHGLPPLTGEHWMERSTTENVDPTIR
jgi:hypothetical protein